MNPGTHETRLRSRAAYVPSIEVGLLPYIRALVPAAEFDEPDGSLVSRIREGAAKSEPSILCGLRSYIRAARVVRQDADRARRYLKHVPEAIAVVLSAARDTCAVSDPDRTKLDRIRQSVLEHAGALGEILLALTIAVSTPAGTASSSCTETSQLTQT